ncbi:MAG: hypothetical protein A2289_00395 [Deltaproteobacteria bacterium RIFOXYA12_FULL_58_15]|nr:MAG: hypothetical protein A2289_00395 [Deltaproteobacteria bacterium RIFOXYA12_FULL_58_15]OGR12013.1 MAG: hypothetical protein A2341_06785 [Deltaproteobacteria bacterium RIFOXYB12_FULL_58_9]
MEIADLRVGLDVPEAIVPWLQPNLNGFTCSDPQWHLTIDPSGDVFRSMSMPPSVIETNGKCRLNAPGNFTVELDTLRQCGTLRFASHPQDWTDRHSPACLLTGLRAFVATEVCRSGGLLLHGGAVNAGGSAALFIGRSGAGKSTTCSAFDLDDILSDEIIGVTLSNDGAWAHATPFSLALDGWRRQRKVQLGNGFLLAKANHTAVCRLPAGTALHTIMQCVPLPRGAPNLEAQAFGMASELAKRIRWHQLSATLDKHDVRRLVAKTVAEA